MRSTGNTAKALTSVARLRIRVLSHDDHLILTRLRANLDLLVQISICNQVQVHDMEADRSVVEKLSESIAETLIGVDSVAGLLSYQ